MEFVLVYVMEVVTCSSASMVQRRPDANPIKVLGSLQVASYD